MERRRPYFVDDIRLENERTFQLQSNTNKTLDDRISVHFMLLLPMSICKRHDGTVRRAELRDRCGHHVSVVASESV